jgi:predicted amidohydrolase YtcJ
MKTGLLMVCLLTLQGIAWGQAADTIYHGADVVTIDDRNPTAEAVAIKGGKIVAVGTKAEVLKLKGEDTKLIDLSGKALLPGFVDGHGHCLYVGVQAASANLLAPPTIL